MAVMGPGIRAGYVDQSIALNIDFMPTFTELAGGIPEPEVDGGSLVPLLLKGTCIDKLIPCNVWKLVIVRKSMVH